ncbi:MAG: nucleoside monophosphate kinase [Candidatus Nomurabacteria bacterium]|nr:MAG: nucleoside monophosphate kinase [Candidatus Nomurabacteria bacterium]HRV75766.1 nucleoside monophosphate kinase [Candidatus Saccharimonadales bacterium]
MKKVIGFIGSPGSGKSTQAEMLAKKTKIELLNLGSVLRKSKDKEVIRVMDSGSLLPDVYVEQIIEKELRGLGKNEPVILDGFFRRKSEVEWLVRSEKGLGFDVPFVFDIAISKKEAIKRLSIRGRGDDGPKDIKKRLKIFEKQYKEVITALKKGGIRIVKVNGEQTPEDVFKEVLEKYKKYEQKLK